MKKLKNLLPEVMPYSDDQFITNPFSGESYECTGEEAAVYDYIVGLQHIISNNGGAFNPVTRPHQQKMRKALDWFRSNNPDAYMILLD
jgi:hypothetical protein